MHLYTLIINSQEGKLKKTIPFKIASKIPGINLIKGVKDLHLENYTNKQSRNRLTGTENRLVREGKLGDWAKKVKGLSKKPHIQRQQYGGCQRETGVGGGRRG